MTRQYPPFTLWLDEFGEYTTDNIAELLTGVRKYFVSVVLAHQFLDQLQDTLRSAVINTAGTIVSMQIGKDDAMTVADEVLPPELMTKSVWRLRTVQVGRWRLPYLRREAVRLTGEERVWLLPKLSLREMWVKRRGPFPPVKLRSADMPDPLLTPEVLQARRDLTETSGRLYARLKAEVCKVLDEERPIYIQSLLQQAEGDDQEKHYDDDEPK